MRHIDADALKKRIEEARQCFGPGGALSDTNYFKAIAFELFGVLLGYIDEAQTLDAEPVRHGHWIKGPLVCGDTLWTCSECEFDDWAVSPSAYCGGCGAKMGKKEE